LVDDCFSVSQHLTGTCRMARHEWFFVLVENKDVGYPRGTFVRVAAFGAISPRVGIDPVGSTCVEFEQTEAPHLRRWFVCSSIADDW
jgi:hypothetical protein